jgi:hypothetical protein
MRRLGLVLALLIVAGDISAQVRDTIPNYWNKAWRDSVAEYQSRVTAYNMEHYSYDWARMFSFVPVAGEWYVDQTGKGITYAALRVASLAVSTVGTIRLTRGYSGTELNIGLIAAGLIAWGYLKWSEMSDVYHMVSIRNEDLVEKWQISTPDIIPGSIRYPRKEWPEWVTSGPPARDPQNAREAVDRPIPSFNNAPVTQIKFEIGF